jgi:hypothetical protein
MNKSTWAAADDRIAAVYKSREEATTARKTLLKELKISDTAVSLIAPDNHEPGRKLEGNSKGIGKNMLWLHLVYGAAGLVVGLILGWLLVNYGPGFTRLNPMFTYIAMLSPGLFIGLFLSGLMSLKPQHDAVNQGTVSAGNAGDWTLLVKLSDESVSKEDVESAIKQTGPKNII